LIWVWLSFSAPLVGNCQRQFDWPNKEQHSRPLQTDFSKK
jgi:hypothetical protein